MSRKPLEIMVVNISEEGLKKKLKFMPRHATATFSGTQIRALLELVSGIESPQASLLDRVREISRAARVTLSRDEVEVLLKLALEVKRKA
ncbi:MAG TPA: hypothetical protein VEW70_02725 [Burkholderiales bacterium]|jgi:hypothetical protein|nr:hypothetical protein [Burkholderiales bacterium]